MPCSYPTPARPGLHFPSSPWSPGDTDPPLTATELPASPTLTLPARNGAQSRGATGRETRRAPPSTAPGVIHPPPGHWPRPPVLVASAPTRRARAAFPLGTSRPDGCVIRPATSGVPAGSEGAPSQVYRRPYSRIAQGSRDVLPCLACPSVPPALAFHVLLLHAVLALSHLWPLAVVYHGSTILHIF